ncbi:hypothetical protein LJB77_02485 [Ruminococcaceae bacterium OttesenSCG-928-N02]|nr:hypothetical protein [Ruminococcaceae bacterium OttesenSCG-928-N02]
MAKAPLTYKGHPLVRNKNEIYFGSMSDHFVVFMQILSTKEAEGETVADKIHLTLLSTDTSLPPRERMVKQSDKNGLYNALDFAAIWLASANNAGES